MFPFFRLSACLSILIFFVSCNISDNIPFPEKELGYSQPVTVPLEFTTAKKINWDTSSKKGITPKVVKLDIHSLPAFAYDSTGFRPFSQPPEEVKFDFNNLPEKDFNLDKLPSIPLDFKTSVFTPGSIVKAGKPIMQKDKSSGIFQFGQAQGLQAKIITSLFKDHSGLLWIGGAEGLFRYDGEHIQTFVKGSLTDYFVTGITEDAKGNIWFVKGGAIGMINLQSGTINYSDKIGYTSNGLSKMTVDGEGRIWVYNLLDTAVSIIDPVAQTFKNFNTKTGFSGSSAIRLIQIVEDYDKNIWITTNGGGIDIIDPIEGKIKYLGKANGLSSDSSRAITVDKNGQIWISVPGGIDAVDVDKGIIKHYGQTQGFKKANGFDLLCDDKGNIWKASRNGVEIADIANNSARRIDQNGGLSGNTGIALLEDNYERVWVGTDQGLSMISQNGKTVHPVGTTEIISLKEDGANNLWIATRDGLYIVNPERTGMHLLDKSHGLSDNFVQSFWDRNGNIIISTFKGYNIFDPVHNTLSAIGKNEGLINDSIYISFIDNAGNTWITGPSLGLDKVDSANQLILHTNISGGLSDNTIMDIKEDKNGLIWLATQYNGIDIIDPANGTIKYLNKQPGVKDTCTRMLWEDEYGRMWIGTDKGIYVADTKLGTLTNISTKQGLSNNTILSILEYNETIVAGTNNKISMISAPKPGDSTGNWKISILNNSTGLFKETNTWQTDATTHDGKYLWGDIGITVINQIKASADSVPTYITGIKIMNHPQYFSKPNQPDGKKLSAAGYADNQEMKWDSVSGPYSMPVNLIVPHNENYLQFQFAQANLGRTDTTLYTYVLEGIDKNWSTPTGNPFTENYLNLSPGKYTFKVSSKGIDGNWSEPAEFKFTISPPWYQTWWAYAIYILLGIGLLRLYVVYRSRKLQKENRILEEKVAHRTSQLKKSLEDLKATQSQLIQSEKMASLGELTAGIAHEIQNPLNFVNNFSEVNMELTDELKEELNKTNLSPDEKLSIGNIADDIKNNQEKITYHGKRADSIVKGMLQHSRNNNGQKELTSINVLADEYLRLAYHGLRAKDKGFNAEMETDFDEALSADNQDGKLNIVPQDVGRVILNLITNAFYAVKAAKSIKGKDYQPTVWVSTKKEGNKVMVTVKDNGTGIPEKVKDKIFQPFFTTKPTGEGTGLGLSLSYDIIKAHGGEITLKTREGEGTEFTLILPA